MALSRWLVNKLGEIWLNFSMTWLKHGVWPISARIHYNGKMGTGLSRPWNLEWNRATKGFIRSGVVTSRVKASCWLSPITDDRSGIRTSDIFFEWHGPNRLDDSRLVRICRTPSNSERRGRKQWFSLCDLYGDLCLVHLHTVYTALTEIIHRIGMKTYLYKCKFLTTLINIPDWAGLLRRLAYHTRGQPVTLTPFACDIYPVCLLTMCVATSTETWIQVHWPCDWLLPLEWIMGIRLFARLNCSQVQYAVKLSLKNRCYKI